MNVSWAETWCVSAGVAPMLQDLHQHFLAHDAASCFDRGRGIGYFDKLSNCEQNRLQQCTCTSSTVLPGKMSFVKIQERTAVRFIFTLEHKVNNRILESSQSRFVLMIKEMSRVTTLSCWWVWEDLFSGLCFFFIAWALSNLFFFPFYLSLAPTAEKVTSLGKDWHKFCLKCERCNKTLTAGGHAEVSVSNVCEGAHWGLHVTIQAGRTTCFLNHSSMKDSF